MKKELAIILICVILIIGVIGLIFFRGKLTGRVVEEGECIGQTSGTLDHSLKETCEDYESEVSDNCVYGTTKVREMYCTGDVGEMYCASTQPNEYDCASEGKICQDGACVDTQTLTLQPGYNYLTLKVDVEGKSINKIEDFRLEQFIGGQDPGLADSIMIYDEINQRFETYWLVDYPAATEVHGKWVNTQTQETDVTLKSGEGFVIENRGETKTITIGGVEITENPVINLVSSWNFIGIPTGEFSVKDILDSTGVICNEMRTLNTQTGDIETLPEDTAIENNIGYFINCTKKVIGWKAEEVEEEGVQSVTITTEEEYEYIILTIDFPETDINDMVAFEALKGAPFANLFDSDSILSLETRKYYYKIDDPYHELNGKWVDRDANLADVKFKKGSEFTIENKHDQDVTLTFRVSEGGGRPQTITLQPGYNYLTLKVDPGIDINRIAGLSMPYMQGGQDPGLADSIMIYDEINQRFETYWLVDYPEAAVHGKWVNTQTQETDVTLKPGEGFVIENRGETKTITIRGEKIEENPVINLVSSWNFIGIPIGEFSVKDILDRTGVICNEMRTLNTQTGDIETLSEDTAIENDVGYFINCTKKVIGWKAEEGEIQTLTLQPSYNYVTLTVEPTSKKINEIAGFRQLIGATDAGRGDNIMKYNKATQGFPTYWLVDLPGNDLHGKWVDAQTQETDVTLEPGEGFIIESKESQTIAITGAQITENITLNLIEGWNFIGIPIGSFSAEEILSSTGGNCTNISRLNLETGEMENYPEEIENFQLEDDVGYFIKCIKDIRLIVSFGEEGKENEYITPQPPLPPSSPGSNRGIPGNYPPSPGTKTNETITGGELGPTGAGPDVGPATGEGEPGEEKEPSLLWLWILIGVLVLVIIIIVIFVALKKNRAAYEETTKPTVVSQPR